MYHALVKLVDYQDYDYARQFLLEMEAVRDLDNGFEDYALTRETARYLSLWMCFEDVPRVAQLKTRAARMEKVREEVKADPDQLIHITDFFRPRIEEFCGMLPASLGRRMQSSKIVSALMSRFTNGKKLRTNTVSVFLVMRLLAGMRRWRRSSLAYSEEYALFSVWLQEVRNAATRGQFEQALELAECGRLIKGYGETRSRTSRQLKTILTRVEQSSQTPAATVALWREAALADDDGKALAKALA